MKENVTVNLELLVKNVMNANVSQPSAQHSFPITSDTGCMQAESQRGARSDQQESGVQVKCQGENQEGSVESCQHF